ncbi:hypothetical protein ACFO5R_20065 [Halosolutus amylolyticus]|uniref:SPW repeat-containing protein n=1 Tax=Halosolutus amylolyticus TaxID=2932267 RepID=A0ABD5PUH7_9EURY|nr:hypothetical protein [Halosolutus amylolyticus]
MTRLEDAPPLVYRTIVVGVVGYFLLLAYATIAGDPLALSVADALFGLIAIGVGSVLYWQSSRELDPITAAATCLVVGGVTQLAGLAVSELDLIASITVFLGILLYGYAIYTRHGEPSPR